MASQQLDPASNQGDKSELKQTWTSPKLITLGNVTDITRQLKIPFLAETGTGGPSDGEGPPTIPPTP